MIMYHVAREIDLLNAQLLRIERNDSTTVSPIFANSSAIGLSDTEKDILTAELYIRSVSRANEILIHHYNKTRETGMVNKVHGQSEVDL